MVEIAILEITDQKNFYVEKKEIEDLPCVLHLIYVPLQKRLKRRIKTKLLKILANYTYVLTIHEKLKGYMKGQSDKSLLYYYPLESIMYLTHGAAYTQTAIVSLGVTSLLKRLIVLFASRFRIVTIYAVQSREMKELLEGLYSSIGLPTHVKNLDLNSQPQEDYLIRVSEDITVYETATGKEYSDIVIRFNYPYSKFKNLPLMEILKIIMDNGYTVDLFQNGMVKIIGEISK